jgi:tRNA pseudouridine65 synthase
MSTLLSIPYRDERVVVVVKPAGLLVHRTSTGSGEEALLQRLRDQLGREVHPVHRLDRMASGLLAYGLDSRAAKGLQAGLKAADALKEYLVLVRGPCEASFESRARLIDDHGVERDAWSEFTRHANFPAARLALLRARIHTGRYHQIRRHLAGLGRHVLGDTRYGKARANRWLASLGLTRLFLHAWRLDIAHPFGGRLAVSAPLPAELAAVLARLAGAGRVDWGGSEEPLRTEHGSTVAAEEA